MAYASLELLVNEKFVAWEWSWFCLVLKHFSWYKNVNLLLKGCIFSNGLARRFSFHNLAENMKALKNKWPILKKKIFCCVWYTKSLKLSLGKIFRESSYVRRILLPKNWGKNTLPIIGSNFCIKWYPCLRNPSKLLKDWALFTPLFVQCYIFPGKCINFNCTEYLITVPLWLKARRVFSNCYDGKNFAIFTTITKYML